jgi:hypothetical protein
MSYSLEYKKTNIVNITSNTIYYTTPSGSNHQIICHIGFKNLEERHAEVVSQNGGNILEVGFGLNCSANKFISSSISSYTCIEINDIIYQQALIWAQDKPNVTIINGAWENIIPTLITQYDGIYYSPTEVDYNLFANTCKSISKLNTIMSIQGVNTFGADTTQYNIDNNVIPPHLFDNVFTQDLYNALYQSEYFKVYWQVYNGNDWSRDLGG